MLLADAPTKVTLPFASAAGSKSTVPVASQIGIVAGGASFTDGFPPLTRTPKTAGGVGPDGLEMNGILNDLSASDRWAAAGGGYIYDSAFANDAHVTGYPAGARIARTDGTGYWLNLTDGNIVDPESSGGAAAGWVPDTTNGIITVAMSSANVTLTPLQYGKPIIVITGAISANLNLIFPAIVGQWVVVNNTTGLGITCKTASGLGVAAIGNKCIYCDAVNIRESNHTCLGNEIINGNFDVWQRGTSQTTSGYGSDDRWVNINTGSTKTHSRQPFTIGQGIVPNEPSFFSRTVVSSSAGAGNFVGKYQKIESARTLACKTAVLSFWAKADSNKNIAVEFSQDFGTGGSPSALVDGIGVTTIALTNSWQKLSVIVAIPSISGKTLGTNQDDSIHVSLWFDAGSSLNAHTNSLGQQSGTFDIAQVQLEEGSIATAFEYRPIATELALCQRYYETIAVGSAFSYDTTTTGRSVILPFKAQKRVVPTCAKTSGSNVMGGGFSIGANLDAPSVTAINLSTATAGAVREAGFTVSVDAEL